ncbi:MAG: mechanosensitive ion channel family protein [Candidatus Doudnabacteria bacterium]
MEFLPYEIEKITQFDLWLPKALGFIGVLVVFWALNYVLRKILKAVLYRTKVHRELIVILVDNVLWLVLWITAFVVAFDYINVDVNAALAGIGFFGVAIGFAAKDSLGNIVAGMMIFWDKPFQVGEWIEVDEKFGQVKTITVRSTRIRTLDNTFIIIPNQTIINSALINHSAEGATRVKIAVSISYDQSIDWARQTLLLLPKEIPFILQEPAPDVIVSNLGDSGVELQLRIWLDDVSKERSVRFKLQELIRKAFAEVDIEIPYPHQTVILKQDK